MRDRILGLKQVSTSKLRGFSGGNPKVYTESDRSLLDASLDNHGYVLPIAVRPIGDGTFEIIDGHHRLDLIAEKEPDAEIKVLVLDVDSVEEGRRILLALKHTADWDLSKLDTFISDALNAGAAAADLMADTGFTGADLDAFSRAGASFLEGSDGGDEDINENPSRAGVRLSHVPFSVSLSREQSASVRKAIKLAKQVAGVKVHGDALAEICSFYVEHHQKQGKPKRERKKKR